MEDENDDNRLLDVRTLAIAKIISGSSAIQVNTNIDYLLETDIIDMTNISKTNSGINSIVDSKSLKRKVKYCIKELLKRDTNCIGKIKICDFLANKLHNIYKLSNDKTAIVIKQLSIIVIEGIDISTPLRLHYLKFKNESISYEVSINVFHHIGIKDNMNIVTYFQILKYILRNSLRKDVHVKEVLNEFDHLFDNPDVSIYTKMEIADIFLLNNREIRGHQMLDMLRNLELDLFQEQEEQLNHKGKLMTVYSDSQNVHCNKINNSVLEASVYLMEIEKPNGFNPIEVLSNLCEISPNHHEIVSAVLERIEIDTSRFKFEDNIFSLYDVFSSLWSYIKKNQYSNDLYKRLIEEMTSMSKYCTTGHLSRFINVLQGYTDDKKLSIVISDEQQIKAVVYNYLDVEMRNASEEITDSMISSDKTPFYDFICTKINQRIVMLCNEYGEVQDYILAAVKIYSDCSSFSITDNKIIIDSLKTFLD